MTNEARYNMYESKRTYQTRKKARKVAKRMKRSGFKGLRPYKCPICNEWHNGHPTVSRVGPDGLIIDDI